MLISIAENTASKASRGKKPEKISTNNDDADGLAIVSLLMIIEFYLEYGQLFNTSDHSVYSQNPRQSYSLKFFNVCY